MRAFGIWGKMMMRGGTRHAKYAPIRKHFAASGRAFSDFSPLDTFEHRHIGPNEGEIKEMLGKLGFQSLEELSTSTVPEHIRHTTDLDLKPALSESEATAKLCAGRSAA